MKCLICNILEADKTGSHIIPHFILESMQNQAGVNGRDKGVSFKLDETSSDFRFGRAITPETLESQLGRPATDEEIEKSVREQHHVEDHIFCTSCETKLSHFESLYKSEIDTSVRDKKNLSDEQLKVLHFFWLSIILRCSVSRHSNFKLQPELEEAARKVVNGILGDSPKEIQRNCLQTSISFKLKVFVNIETGDKTRNSILLHPVYKNPYLLFINEYVLLFEYNSPSQIIELFRFLKIQSSSNVDAFCLTYITEADWENVISYCFGIKAKQMYKNNIERFQNSYFQKYFTIPPASLTQSYMDELIRDDELIDETTKYSEDRIQKLIGIYISKF
jgi:hypothetical protein